MIVPLSGSLADNPALFQQVLLNGGTAQVEEVSVSRMVAKASYNALPSYRDRISYRGKCSGISPSPSPSIIHAITMMILFFTKSTSP
jgi:hypothetical protein